MNLDLRSDAQGFTLMELSIALLIFLIGVLGLLQLMIASVNINQRSLDTTLVTSLAQGKADELLSKTFATLATGGSVPAKPAEDPLVSPSPQTCYVDYFDNDGTRLIPLDACGTSAPPSGYYFVRRWDVSSVTGTTNLKKITVTVTAQNSYFAKSRPCAIIVVYKSNV